MIYLVTYGETWLKSEKTKKELLRMLVNNLRKKGIENIDLSERGFIIIKDKDVLDKLRKTFGINKIYIAEEVETDWNKIKEKFLNIAKKVIKQNTKFRITAKRVYKEFPLDSYNIQKELGSLVKWGKVDLKNYDIEITINIRKNRTFIYWESFDGAGGLPLGSEGSALALVSGGFDSPVAAWYIMRRGIKITILYFNPFDEYLDISIYELYKKFKEWDPEILFLSIPFSKILLEIIRKISKGYRQVVLKRIMYRLAEKVCDKFGYKAIVLGETIGQKSSQTLENLYTIQKVIKDKIIFRPLIGFDKEETIKKNIELGFYDICIKVPDVCKLEEKAYTEISEEEIIKEEEKLDIDYDYFIKEMKPIWDLNIVSIKELIRSQKVNKNYRKVWYTRLNREKDLDKILIVCPLGYTAFSLSIALRKEGKEVYGIGKND